MQKKMCFQPGFKVSTELAPECEREIFRRNGAWWAKARPPKVFLLNPEMIKKPASRERKGLDGVYGEQGWRYIREPDHLKLWCVTFLH